ncbi:hypothetical protein SCUP234_05109 [Seiridium cupressi]
MIWFEEDDQTLQETTVAAKVPKFRLQPNAQLDLSDPEAQKHLHVLHLEVTALTHPELHFHPNIVRLISWTFNSDAFYIPISLIMELSMGNLHEILRSGYLVGPMDKLYFCHDIASGLDVLHNNGFIHGDLKSENVLIFWQDGHYIAKLADFGLSVDEVDSLQTASRLGGTAGWQAPEVEKGLSLSSFNLKKADNFSFGLVVWSMMLYSGGTQNWTLLRFGLLNLVQQEASRRPGHVANIFPFRRHSHTAAENTGEETDSKSFDQRVAGEDSRSREPHRILDGQSPVPTFTFEDHGISAELLVPLMSRYKRSDESLNPTVLFNLFLYLSIEPFGPVVPNPAQNVLDYLLTAASEGSCPARAVVQRVLEFFDEEISPHLKLHSEGWLEDGVSSGSILARDTLFERDRAGYTRAVHAFHSSGGYNSFYSQLDPLATRLESLSIDSSVSSNYSKLHWLAAFGSVQDLEEFMTTHPTQDVNEMTTEGETPIYIACARGCWDMASELMAHGASASYQCTSFGISCLHWLFNFKPEFQEAALTKLLEHGADINGCATRPLPFPHYPFQLPAGTALHWAVALSSNSATESLVKHGADLHIRDGCDPYKFDRRIRAPNTIGGPNQTYYSTPQKPTQGLSPLDYAAIELNPFLFELLSSSSLRTIDINSVDEEGVGLLHRLSAHPKVTTRFHQEFSRLTFMGGFRRREDNSKRTVTAIKCLGGNLDLQTRPNSPEHHGRMNSLTPLMMAASSGRPEVVEALLDQGANVHTLNSIGENALHCLSQNRPYDKRTVELLCAAGADTNQRSDEDMGPLIKAGLGHCLEAVDVLLSYGADVLEVYDQHPETQSYGANVFALLSRMSEQTAEAVQDYDLALSKVLERFLRSATDGRIRRKLLDKGDKLDRTLLWHYSEHAMQHCVNMLIAYGVDINSSGVSYRPVTLPNSVEELEIWRETPLDIALANKSKLEKRMGRDRHLLISEYEGQIQNWNIVLNALIRAGGRGTSGQVVRVPAFPGWRTSKDLTAYAVMNAKVCEHK